MLNTEYPSVAHGGGHRIFVSFLSFSCVWVSMMPGRFDEITSHLTLDELCICISSEDEWAVRNTWFLLRWVVDEGLDYDLFSVLGFSSEFGIEMCIGGRLFVT